MKKIPILLIGSLILNASLFLIIGAGGKKPTGTRTHAAGESTESAPRPQEKNTELSETVSPPLEPRASSSPQTPRLSANEASAYTAANSPVSPPASPYKTRTASTASALSPAISSVPSSSTSSGYVAPLPDAGSSAPIQSYPVAISIPAGPGNSITYRGQQAAITAARAATDSEPASLDASVTSVAGSAPNSSTAQTGNSTEAPQSSSMSFDDQLFRTKWGWEAYDQARKAASLAASAAATPGN
ncbi:hypothetical protein TSACC_14 [Terrimicrobium sacchariphilum]|uniref:Uncharacterized protein n=1 Tax=Terrimicrobium sacchariphilum TaxID=690879 RepID=A0A146G3P8_TERSA|nr:hypothetical protein [Terrimicrobium sacchariphilum]GAT31456.1 hypothetical protein TSACC_14 [Terrimicrobium sacchariphilum]